MRSFFRRFLEPFLDQRGDFGGFLVLTGVVALAGTVYLAIFHGTADQGIKALAKTEVIRIKVNYELLVSEFGEIKADTPIPANDNRVVTIKEALGKLKTFSDQVRGLAQNAVQGSVADDAIAALNAATACVVEPPLPAEGAPTGVKSIQVSVKARIPLPPDAAVSLTSDKGDTSAMSPCPPASCSTPFSWKGYLTLVANDPNLAGKTTKIQVAGPNIACNAVGFRWKFEPPKIAGFTKSPLNEIQPGTKVTLSWVIKNAQSADVNGTAVNPALGTLDVAPIGDTIYTLNASSTNPATGAVHKAEPATQTVKVVKASYFVTASAGGDQFTTASSVTVSGTVTPAPPAGTLVAIGLNGVPVTTATVDGGGSYSTSVALAKITPLGKLRLTNAGQVVGVCGSRESPVILWNDAGPDDVANVFTAAVLKEGGGASSNVATVQIAHAVQIVSATVSWSGQCPGPFENLNATGVLRAGQNRQLGTTKCGVACNVPKPPPCTATARASVSTSIGSLFADGFWSISIQ